MNLLDRLALAGRRYERRRSNIDGSTELSLDEVLRVLHGKTILEISLHAPGKPAQRTVHQQGRPVSVLDYLAEAGGGDVGTYEVLQTAPSGDYTRLRIICRPSGGEVSMLVGRRTPEHTTAEDPLLETLQNGP